MLSQNCARTATSSTMIPDCSQSTIDSIFVSVKPGLQRDFGAVWRGHMLGWNRKSPSLLFNTNKSATRSRMASTTGNISGLIYQYDHITSTQVTSPYSRRTASVWKESSSWSLRLGDTLQYLRLEVPAFPRPYRLQKVFGRTSGSGVEFGK
jgi:hypothetical protein